jgi:hypothetical protein
MFKVFIPFWHEYKHSVMGGFSLLRTFGAIYEKPFELLHNLESTKLGWTHEYIREFWWSITIFQWSKWGNLRCNASAWTVPVAAKFKAWVWGLSLAKYVGSNAAGSMDVSFECCELSGRGRGLWVVLITRPEESYRLWCDRESAISCWAMENEEIPHLMSWPRENNSLNIPHIFSVLKCQGKFWALMLLDYIEYTLTVCCVLCNSVIQFHKNTASNVRICTTNSKTSKVLLKF